MTPEQLRTALAKGTVAPAYFLSGPETGRKQEALDALAALVPEASRAFNVQVFHAFEADFAEMLTAARTLPFMGPRRLVVLRDIEKARLDQGGRAALLEEYLGAPAPETVFVVTTEDEAKAKSLGRQFEGRWAQVEFRALQGGALEQALRQEAERLALRFAGGAAAEALLAATGADLARAHNELEKLRAALGEGGVIDEVAVGRYVAGYEHHGTKDITDAISRRDLTGALRLLSEVAIKDDDFLGLLGMIGKRLRVLWYLSGGEREVPKEFNVRNAADWLGRDARKFTQAEIEGGLAGLRLLDDRVKSTQVPPKLLLEHFLLGFLSR